MPLVRVGPESPPSGTQQAPLEHGLPTLEGDEGTFGTRSSSGLDSREQRLMGPLRLPDRDRCWATLPFRVASKSPNPSSHGGTAQKCPLYCVWGEGVASQQVGLRRGTALGRGALVPDPCLIPEQPQPTPEHQ